MVALSPTETIDLVAQLLVLCGLVFTAVRFGSEKKREFQKSFFEGQLRTFEEAVDAAASLSVHEKDSPDYRVARNRFMQLYWGKMCIFEDIAVEIWMVRFSAVLGVYDSENDTFKVGQIKQVLHQTGLGLAHNCRNSSLSTWKIEENILAMSNDHTDWESVRKMDGYRYVKAKLEDTDDSSSK